MSCEILGIAKKHNFDQLLTGENEAIRCVLPALALEASQGIAERKAAKYWGFESRGHPQPHCARVGEDGVRGETNFISFVSVRRKV